jgi:excinuclease ABC subunit B
MDAMRPACVRIGHASRTEMEQTGGVFTEQIIRPTGLLDLMIERPVMQ